MRGLIESAIEREAERLDEIMESMDRLDDPFFAPRHFRSRIRRQAGNFASRAGSQRRFSASAASSNYAN